MRKTLIILLIITVLLLAYTFKPTFAQQTTDQINSKSSDQDISNNIKPSPDFSSSLLEELNKKLQKVTPNEDMFSANSKQSMSPLDLQTWVTIDDIVASAYGPIPGNASLENPGNIVGEPDNNFAHLHTETYRDIKTDTTDESIIVASMETWTWGPIYITGHSGNCTSSVVSVAISDSLKPMLSWENVGVAQLDQTNRQIYINDAHSPFRYIAIYCWSEPDHQYNDAYVDSVKACQYEGSSNVLSISAGEGGTTDPEPGGYYYYGETAEITAIPNENYIFDHWDIDFGNYQSTDNPIYQQTWDGDHYLTAYFTYSPPEPGPQKLTISTIGSGITYPVSGDHWYDYNSVIEVDASLSGFSYWLLDGEYVFTGDSISVTMDQFHTLEAHFNEQLPTCEVTINAIEVTSQSLAETNVYVDSQYVGATNLIYDVANFQQHTIEGEFYAYVPQWQAYGSSWWTEVNGVFYDYWYSATVTPSSLHMTVTFVYICAK